MALYRNGTASMDAQGNITGVGTKWKEPLSLIRTGATIVFLTSPLKLAVINTIVSDTSMTAITTDGEAVPNGNYAILLSDSLTVDGMAQDVAETLRYYQSKETQIEEAIEFFENFDFQQLIDLKNQTQQFRNDAEGFKNNAASSATAANNAKTAAETARTQAQQAQTGAQTARNDAQTAKGQAETARDKSQTYRDQAEQFANSVNPANLLHKDQNLSDVANKDLAKENLNLGRFSESAASTNIRYPSKNSTFILRDSDLVWGVYDNDAGNWRSLGIGQGGTGSTSAGGARSNLQAAGLPDNNVFTGTQTVKNQNGLTIQPGTGQSNAWLNSGDSKGVIRYRLGLEGDNLYSLYGYNTSSEGARKIYEYSYDLDTISFRRDVALSGIVVPSASSATAPIGSGIRGLCSGVDSANFNNASNINLYSWFGIGFCTSYTSPTNGVLQGKPAVYINTRDGNINAKGSVQANGVTLTSDWNAKENISIINPSDALDMMGRLDGWKFRYKENSSNRMTAGILAQDLDLVIPDLVIKPENTPEVDEDGNIILDDEGNPVNDGDNFLTADYMGLMGYMVAAIKGNKIKNDELRGEIEGLKSEVECLKALVKSMIEK